MRKSRAFTLVELLIVVAILALLMGMLLPTLQKALKIAEDAVCKSNLRSIQQALLLYAKDHEGYMPCSNQGDRPPYYFDGWNKMLTTGYGPNKYNWVPTTSYVPKGAFECPSYEWRYSSRGSYGINWAMQGYDAAGQGDYIRGTYPRWQYELEATLRPGRVYLVGDTTRHPPYGHHTNFLRLGAHCTPTFRHLEHCNVVFHDGHVEPLEDAEIPAQVYCYLPWFNREEYAF